jgi:hypothetical protein
MPFLSILLSLLMMVLIFGAIYWVVGLLPFPEPFRKIALAIIGIIFLIYLIGMLLGAAPPFPIFRGGYRY